MKKIYLASDHAGYELKAYFSVYLAQKGYMVEDLGPVDGQNPISYAEQGAKLAKALTQEKNKEVIGLAFCGTGLGISMALNRFDGVRAARVTSIEDAKYAKAHNGANVLTFGGRQLDNETARAIFEEFEKTEFEGGRHRDRIIALDHLHDEIK